MKDFDITIYIRGRKKPMRGVRAFPSASGVHDVRQTMEQLLLYYYFKRDILKIDVFPIKENNSKSREQSLLTKIISFDK